MSREASRSTDKLQGNEETSFKGKRTSGRFRKQLEWDSREVSEAARPQGTEQASSRHS